MSVDPTARNLAAQARAAAQGGGPGPSQPWYWSPPLAADFSVVTGTIASPTMTDDPHVGLMFETPNPAAHDWRWALKPVPTPAADWSVTARISCTTIDVDGPTIMGLALRKSTDSTRLLLVGLTHNGGLAYHQAEPFSPYSSNNPELNFHRWSGFGDFWFRAQHIASTSKMIYSASSDGKIWMPAITKDDTDLFSAIPDQIGLGSWFDRTNYPGGFSCAAWSEAF